MADRHRVHDDEPLFVISIAAKMVGMHAQSLRHYERLGLVRPSRSRGRVRFYSQADIQRLLRIQRLVNDLGVNLAGVDVILRMNRQIEELQQQLAETQAQVARLSERAAGGAEGPTR